ncbi:MAG: hypothetical protein PHF87_09270 [Desulfotomaculaceae bacterium]|nr:hypothetical protein [Desulfotomaculaceae bacterium]
MEIEAEIPDGFPDKVVQIVTENSQAFRFKNHGFRRNKCLNTVDLKLGSEIIMVDEKDDNKNKSTESGLTLTSVVMAMIILAFVGAIAKGIVRGNHNIVASWNTYTIGTIGPALTLTTPSEPNLISTEAPAVAQIYTQSYEEYECTSDAARISLFLINGQYKSGLGTPNLQGATDGTVFALSQVEGTTVIQRNTTPIVVSGKNGTLITLTTDEKGDKIEEKILIFIDGLKYWQVCIRYMTSDKAGGEAAQKVVESLSFQSPYVSVK